MSTQASIPAGLVQYLLEIGRTQAFSNLDRVPALFPEEQEGQFVRLAPESWFRVADSHTQEVTLLYHLIRRRAPDPGGFRFYVGMVRAGRHADALDTMLHSSEHRGIYDRGRAAHA